MMLLRMIFNNCFHSKIAGKDIHTIIVYHVFLMKNVLTYSTDLGYMTCFMDHKIIPVSSKLFYDGVGVLMTLQHRFDAIFIKIKRLYSREKNGIFYRVNWL